MQSGQVDPNAARREARGLEQTHRQLAHWNHRRLAVGAPHEGWETELAEDVGMQLIEGRWVESLRREVIDEAAEAPTGPDAFIAWFESLKQVGPGQGDSLFPWLAKDAGLEDLRWFLTQEAAGEAGFDDLVALTQVKMPDRAKLELARNYWDEMGRGSLGGMHGPMLAETVRQLGLTPTIDTTVWPSLALANTLTAFATTRRYAYHAIGALGIVELTAPTRVVHVADGLKRLGAPPVARKYFALHAHLDVEHSKAWNAEVLKPLVAETPGCARYIAEGALMRLLCGARCFDAYRAHLWRGALSMAAE